MMKSWLVRIRNFKLEWLYRWFLKPYFFKRDPEKIHDKTLRLGVVFGKNRFWRRLIKICFGYSNSMLKQRLLGIEFDNPIGLAAGFDKNGELVDILPLIGFGFMEVGSVTGQACEGNKKPRLWRLIKSRSLVVYYGLKNDGAKAICARLRGRKLGFPVGISIAKTNSKDTVVLEAGISDYLIALKECRDVGSYVTVNISCPNTFGGQPFHDQKSFEALFTELDKVEVAKPIFVKISPDLTKEEVDGIILSAKRHRVDGFIISNLTKRLEIAEATEQNVPQNGGIGGKLLEERANELVGYVYRQVKGEFVIIGCGGVDSAEGAYKKIKLGANLVQLVTGMIYKGPQLISSINEGLVRLAKKDGYKNIAEAVGVDWNGADE